MNKVNYILAALLLLFNLASAQTFWLNVPASTYEVAGGAGIETALEIGFCGEHTAPVYLSANSPKAVSTIFQPAVVTNSQQVVLSMIGDSTIIGQRVDISIQATDGLYTDTRQITLDVDESVMDGGLAKTYRDSALSHLALRHPEVMGEYGDLRQLDWQGFTPYPPFLIVSHYVFLSGDWRVIVLWHVMIPPDDWKRIYVCNENEGVYWGVEIDTNGDYKEIPCRQLYYFLQDPTAVGKNDRHPYVRSDFVLSQNYPNPFNPETVISYSLSADSEVTLTIHNLLGQVVTTLIDERQSARTCQLKWNGTDKRGTPVPSGLYVYTLKFGGHVQSRKMLLLK